MNLKIPFLCALVLLLSSAFGQSQDLKTDKSTEYPSPTIREERQVVVDGVTETWRLQWKEAPRAYCAAKDVGALTCPCTGFAYGELGDLYLIRLRNGSEIDRLHLTPLFNEEDGAVVQRWPMDDKHDFQLSERNNFSALVSRRATVQVMQFADYDHDGRKTEFFLQTESAPCGKIVGIVVGISANNPRLHVFSTASHPTKPLYLQKHEWQALRDDSSGAVDVADWFCGDHGSETQTEVHLKWSAKGIEGEYREYTCPLKNESRRLVKENPL